MFFLCDRREIRETMDHETGHAFQNCFFGIFMIPLTIASVVRYHYRNFMKKRGKPCASLYDDFWFEGQATRLGSFLMKKIN